MIHFLSDISSKLKGMHSSICEYRLGRSHRRTIWVQATPQSQVVCWRQCGNWVERRPLKSSCRGCGSYIPTPKSSPMRRWASLLLWLASPADSDWPLSPSLFVPSAAASLPYAFFAADIILLCHPYSTIRGLSLAPRWLSCLAGCPRGRWSSSRASRPNRAGQLAWRTRHICLFSHSFFFSDDAIDTASAARSPRGR